MDAARSPRTAHTSSILKRNHLESAGMPKKRKAPPPSAPPPEQPSLDGIVFSDGWLFVKIFFITAVVHSLFKGIVVPFVGPEVWTSRFVEALLNISYVLQVFAVLLNMLISFYFHFRNRIRRGA